MAEFNIWVMEILAAFEKLGEQATLQEIYDVVEQRSSINLGKYKDWKSRVRKNIYIHSSDCEIFKGTHGDTKDLFYSVNGIGNGIWGVRKNL